MAPFNTHFLVAEKMWSELQHSVWGPHFGQFCFGCVAPDVDKASQTLTQKDTHFFDRTTAYDLMASARTSAFLARQREFLVGPFRDLSAEAQAFVLGYLCHLAVDEVSKHGWRIDVWLNFQKVRPTAAFAALDELAWHRTADYSTIRQALQSLEALDVITVIPWRDLQRMLAGVKGFAAAKNVFDEYLTLIDLFDPGRSQAEREASLARLEHELAVARPVAYKFNLEALVPAAVAHTHRRIDDLLSGRVPDAGFPAL